MLANIGILLIIIAMFRQDYSPEALSAPFLSDQELRLKGKIITEAIHGVLAENGGEVSVSEDLDLTETLRQDVEVITGIRPVARNAIANAIMADPALCASYAQGLDPQGIDTRIAALQVIEAKLQ